MGTLAPTTERLDIFGSTSSDDVFKTQFSSLTSLESVSLSSEASYFLVESSQTPGSHTLTSLLVAPAKVPGPVLIRCTWVTVSDPRSVAKGIECIHRQIWEDTALPSQATGMSVIPQRRAGWLNRRLGRWIPGTQRRHTPHPPGRALGSEGLHVGQQHVAGARAQPPDLL